MNRFRMYGRAILNCLATAAMLCVIIIGQRAFADASNPCYANITRSCGALNADTGRVCHTGNNSVPCGDIIVQDGQVNDVRLADQGESGKHQPVDTPCGSVAVQIDKYSCNGGTCNHNGITQFTCQGRCATGSNCTGTGSGGT
jgi:hypothetical protein